MPFFLGLVSFSTSQQTKYLSAFRAFCSIAHLNRASLRASTLGSLRHQISTVAGGEAYRRDDPRAEVHILDAGHFALDLKPKEVIRLMADFMKNVF